MDHTHQIAGNSGTDNLDRADGIGIFTSINRTGRKNQDPHKEQKDAIPHKTLPLKYEPEDELIQNASQAPGGRLKRRLGEIIF
jgi:hypothetical protein